MELAGRIGDAMVAATPKILVIDDQHLIANTLAQILNQNGYDAAPVYSSEEALEQVNHLSRILCSVTCGCTSWMESKQPCAFKSFIQIVA